MSDSITSEVQWWRSLDGILATGFGSGQAPRAPGTVGSLAALPAAYGLMLLPWTWTLAVVIVASVAGIWICGRYSERLQLHDAGCIVWDEFAGLWLALCFAPASLAYLIAGFVLFRLFDIWKPWPVGPLDRRVDGGLGIMVDDLVAGLYAAGGLWLLEWFIGG